MTNEEVIHYFNSRDTRHRAPFGAVAAGTEVFFRICLPRGLSCSAARLFFETSENGGKDIPSSMMFWAGMNGEGHEWWECHYTHETAAVLRYGFELDTGAGLRWLSRREDGTAQISAENPRKKQARCWQLTCYAADFRVPEWPAGGIMYQIFPDRFARSGTLKSGVPEDRKIHESWDDTPEWRPDEQGKVLNNDYFGGDLRGIEQRLDRLAELGITCIYLNPVFEAHSNHRYDTADYTKIDPLLGSEEEFSSLLSTANQLGIRIILDGVFSHTGADSVYFNKNGRYSGAGATQSQLSPYFSWYSFTDWPHKYKSWWGFETLPDVDETNADFQEFICGEDGVLRRRIRQGAGGWRLDVADELPDVFLDRLREAVKAENEDAVILGEVWEDASNKESYGNVRRYLLGRQLDSVMNYPFRDAVIKFVKGGSSQAFFNSIFDILENYPPQTVSVLMNMLGTHDTERILTVLAGEDAAGRGREWQSVQRLSPEQRERGIRLMRLATAIQYTLPGVPCVYYGDEAGMEGYRDPFNRGSYPWVNGDAELFAWHKALGRLRKSIPVFANGSFETVCSAEHAAVYCRRKEENAVLCAINTADTSIDVPLPDEWHGTTVSMGGGTVTGGILMLPPVDCAIICSGC